MTAGLGGFNELNFFKKNLDRSDRIEKIMGENKFQHDMATTSETTDK